MQTFWTSIEMTGSQKVEAKLQKDLKRLDKGVTRTIVSQLEVIIE